MPDNTHNDACHRVIAADRSLTGSTSWTLTGPDGAPYQSDRPGTLGGHRRSKVYGRLDCRSALRALARGGYALDRVFFLDEHAAQAAGYRPCAVCLPDEYAAWPKPR